MVRKRILKYFSQNLLFFVTKLNNIHLSTPDILIHVDENKVEAQYNVLLYYYLTFILKRLRTLIRTFEAQITEKIRTSSLGEKKGVLIKKKVYSVAVGALCQRGTSGVE